MTTPILAPAAMLVVWTLIVLIWLAAVRMPVFKRMGGVGKLPRGARGGDLEAAAPPRVTWPSHNYTHLLEQPTLFYAVTAILAIAGASETDVVVAWIYTGSRIAHSLWQGLVNIVSVRFALFLLGTIALVYLTLKAVAATLL